MTGAVTQLSDISSDLSAGLHGKCSVTKQVGLGALETFSRGVGTGRYISVMRHGSAPKRVRLNISIPCKST